jgi:hypothetical protein
VSGPPSEVRVLGQRLEVEVLGRMDSPDKLGTFKIDQMRIELAERQGRESMADTLLHELVHAGGDMLGLGLREQQVRGLTVALLALLRDNPELVGYLLVPT